MRQTVAYQRFLTGGRLDEVLRMKLDQFNWKKGPSGLYASKTENERDVPLSKGNRASHPRSRLPGA